MDRIHMLDYNGGYLVGSSKKAETMFLLVVGGNVNLVQESNLLALALW